MTTNFKIPFYIRASLFLVGMYVFISMLSIGQVIILPIIYATILAILFSPLVNFLVRKKINRALSVACVLVIVFLMIATLIALLSSQANLLRESWPKLVDKFQALLDEAIIWASGYFNISPQKINTWLIDTKNEILNISTGTIGVTLTTVGGVLAATFLIPVYVFMILFYQPLIMEFIHQLFGSHNNNVSEILAETKGIIKSYLVGLFAEFSIVAVLNSVGLLILGIDYAILLGIIGALLNVIPYIGGIIGVILFMIIALVTKPPIYVLYVMALYAFIQFIDNHFIVPKIVGSKVKLNALVSLVAVISGAALWGIPGMFLSIPIIAIVKVIFDRIEFLKPWGLLLGDTTSPIPKNTIIVSSQNDSGVSP